jgi:hypothetical protein
VSRIHQVHRTTSTAAQAGLPAQHFRECRLDVTPFCKDVTVTPMAGEEQVFVREL